MAFLESERLLRVATSKMRELPLDLPEQKETYGRICAKFIYLHEISWGCVYNLDETNVHYGSFKNETRARKGAKRIRQHGKGSDKAQITVTLGACSKLKCQHDSNMFIDLAILT